MPIHLKISSQPVFIFLLVFISVLGISFVFVTSVNNAYAQEQSLGDQLRSIAERIDALEATSISLDLGSLGSMTANATSRSLGWAGAEISPNEMWSSQGYLDYLLHTRARDRHTPIVGAASDACLEDPEHGNKFRRFRCICDDRHRIDPRLKVGLHCDKW